MSPTLRSLLPACALLLFFSCSKGSGQLDPVDSRDSNLWQTAQWELCSQEIQKHLNPVGREKQMRTLDAAYVAILKDDGGWEESRVLPFVTDGDACEAVFVRDGQKASLDILRKGERMGLFLKDGDVYSGESAGISFDANPFVYDGSSIKTDICFKADGVTLARFEADGTEESTDVFLDLISGIRLDGNVERGRLWDALRALTDANDTEQAATPFVEEAASAIHVPVYYEGDFSTPHGYVTMVPLHLLNRYDNYWTWDLVVMANDGRPVSREAFRLDKAFEESGSMNFYNAWFRLIPHILLHVLS